MRYMLRYYFLQKKVKTKKLNKTDKRRIIMSPLDFIFSMYSYYSIHVPVGFVCDGASIPRLAKPFFGGHWNKKYIRAAVIHDYLYFYNGIIPVFNWIIDKFVLNNYFIVSRDIADLFFYFGLHQINWFRRNIMYKAVRFGGLPAWKYRESKWSKQLHPYKRVDGINHIVHVNHHKNVYTVQQPHG